MKSRGAGWVLLAAVVGCAVTARLGVWQLDRATGKLALQAEIDARVGLPVLEAPALARDAAAAAGQHYRPVQVQGRWLREGTVWLDNRQMDGHPGFFVVTPLLLAPGDAILVQRGWLPRNSEDRSALPPLDTPEGEVEVTGRVAPPPSRLFEFAGEVDGPIRQNLDLDTEAHRLGVALRPMSIQQLPAPGLPDEGLQRRWAAPAVDVSRHYGYAFQWFALCTLIAGLYVWFQLLRPRLRRSAR